MDKNLQHFEFIVNEETSDNMTKNDQDKCNQCKYTSSQAGNLKRNLKKRNGEKEFKCNQCNYATAYASALRTHLTTHSGEKSYKCNQCNYASSQASHLRTHLKTHREEQMQPV